MHKIPKGKLLLIGGAEDKGDTEDPLMLESRNIKRLEILSLLIPERKNGGSIEVITTASSIPDEINAMYRKAFRKVGFRKVGFMNMGNHPDACNPLFIARVKKAKAVLFSGGDQFRLSTILGNTDVLQAVLEKYFDDPDFIVAGTSAGAMAASTLMMYEVDSAASLLKGAVKISSGMGFMDACIIDTHFTNRGRFGRLAQAVVMNPTCVGIGLSENTALLIKHGKDAQCIGSGMVIVIDGKNVGHTNIAYAKNGDALCIENLKVHILCEGNGYQFDERKFVPSKKDITTEDNAKIKIKKIRKEGEMVTKKKAAKKQPKAKK